MKKALKPFLVILLCVAITLIGLSICALSDDEDIQKEDDQAAYIDITIDIRNDDDTAGDRFTEDIIEDDNIDIEYSGPEVYDDEYIEAESYDTENNTESIIDGIVASMTLEDKIAQMFIVTPEQLVHENDIKTVNNALTVALRQYPVSGIICFAGNIENADQIKKFTGDLKENSAYPLFFCIDEEGGTVDRFKDAGLIAADEAVGDASDLGAEGSAAAAYEAGVRLGNYCQGYGFNVDLAPVADIYTTEASGMERRSYSSDADVAAEMVADTVKGIQSTGVSAVLKHFPGHGATDGDSHYGAAVTMQTLEGMREKEFLPFEAGIEAGADMVMMGHISAPNVTDEEMPASISRYFITDILRNELGYNGVIISDSFSMQAVTSFYDPAEAAVEGVKAGLDQILMPEDFRAAYNGLLSAVRNGEISEERIDESLKRTFRLKLDEGNS